MKKIENTFAVTGFIGKDGEIHQFTSASVARFPLAVSRLEKNGETRLFQCRLSRQQKQNDIHSKYTVEEGHSNPNGARTEHTAEGGCCIRTRKRGSEKMAIGKGRNRIRQKSGMLFT